METVQSSFKKKYIKCLERIKPFYASCHHDNIYEKVVSFTTNQNAAGVVLMILQGPTSSELIFFII